jgi:para-nitrobenzyl esterase
VPILDGTNHDEEAIFVEGVGVAVSGGTFVPVPEPVTAGSYQPDIAVVLGVRSSRAAIAARYPLTAYPAPAAALSALVGDANFACPALQLDRWTSRRVPTFAYELNDDTTPQRFVPPGKVALVATHGSELQYLFDLPNAPVPGMLSAGQKVLAASMRTAWRGSPPPAAPRPRLCPGPRLPAAATRPCCRSCRHARRPRRTSPPGTTAALRQASRLPPQCPPCPSLGRRMARTGIVNSGRRP